MYADMILPCSWKMENTTLTEEALEPDANASSVPQHFCTDNGAMDWRQMITETQLVPSENGCTQCTSVLLQHRDLL